MKLAEALIERKALAKRVADLTSRAAAAVLVTEGEAPKANSEALFKEAMEAAENHGKLVAAINWANMNCKLTFNGEILTITEAIAKRDAMTMQLGIVDAMLKMAMQEGRTYDRYGGDNPVTTKSQVEPAKAQKLKDSLAEGIRKLDTAIQGVNWNYDIAE